MEGPSCGLIPFNGPTVASSTGLKWNLGTHPPLFAANPPPAVLPFRHEWNEGSEARRCGFPADDTEMRFGGLISTSNEIESDVVTVETNQPLIWTTELRA